MKSCCKLLLVLTILFSGQVFSQSFTLIKDINTSTLPMGSNPEHLTDVNGTLFFVASNTSTGQELWKSDGTEAGTTLVKDIWTGIGSSEITSLIVAGDNLIFTANDGMNGQEVWRSNGTAAGTMMVQDIVIPGGSFPFEYTVVGNSIFASISDEDHGRELWIA